MATDAQGRELSPDGNYYWDGSDWQLVDQSAASGGDSSPASGGDGGFSSGGDGPMSSQSTATDAQGRQLSPDGNYYWDGSDWQPVSASGSAGSAAGGDPSSASAGAGTTQTPDSPGSSGGDDGSSSGGYSGSSAGGDGSASSQSGQLSPDGNYYWDGANWQPVSASVGSSAGGDPSSASPGAFGSGDQSLNATGAQPAMVPASEDVGGSPAFEFTLPEITIADGEFNAGAAVVHVDLSVSGSVQVALPGHVEGATLTAEGLQADAQQSLHGLTAGLQVSGLGSEAVGISGTYGNEYSQSSYGFEDGSMVYKGQCKISYSWSCPHGQVEVEGSSGYTLKIKVMPGDSGTEETEEELGNLLATVSVIALVAVLAPELLPVAAAAAQQAVQAGQ